MNTGRRNSWMLAVVGMAFGMVSCTNEDDVVIPVEVSYTDPAQDLEEFRQRVLAAENGWEAVLRPQSGKMFRLFLELDAQGKVSMYADVDTTAAGTATTTTYRLETTQTVNSTLIFDANSSLDRIQTANPKRGVDKAYSYKSGKGDTLRLLGNLYGDELLFIKAPKDVRNRYKETALKSSVKNISKYLSNVRFLYIQPEQGKLIQFMTNPISREIYVTYLNNGAKFFGSDYSYSLEGISLKSPLSATGYETQEFFWDESGNRLYTFYNGQRVDLKTSPIPVIPLHYLLGTEYPPGAVLESTYLESLPGWSAKFQNLWLLDDNALFAQQITLYYVYFDLHLDTKTMDLYVYYVKDDTYVRGKFPYTFTETADGVFDFTPLPIDDSPEGKNAKVLEGKMPNIFGVINDNRFHIEFYDAYEELGGLLPQYISVDDPTIYFTGLFY